MTALNVALLVQLFGMIFALVMDPFINKRSKRIMMINTVLVLTLVIQQQAGAYFDENNMIAARIVSGVYGYSIRPVIISLFIKIFTESKKMWILVGLNAAVYCTAFFSELSFYYSESGNFMRGPLGYSCFVVSVILLIQLIFASVRNYRKTMNRLSVFPFVVVILITAAAITDIFILKTYRIDLLTVVSASSCVLYYIWLHLQFVREHENDLKAEQRIRIMMSQMSPHFLFNTLAAIQSLCRTDPPLRVRRCRNSEFICGRTWTLFAAIRPFRLRRNWNTQRYIRISRCFSIPMFALNMIYGTRIFLVPRSPFSQWWKTP